MFTIFFLGLARDASMFFYLYRPVAVRQRKLEWLRWRWIAFSFGEAFIVFSAATTLIVGA